MWITLLAWTAPTAEAACDRAEITKVLEALTQVSSEHLSELAAVGISDACTGPTAWVNGARDLAMVSPDMRSMIDARVALETPGEWMAICSGGLQPLIDMSAVAASEKRAMLWRACDLERHGWMTEAQWTSADGAIVIALVGGHVLTETGVGADDVATLVRALAGVGGSSATEVSPPPELGDPFLELGGAGVGTLGAMPTDRSSADRAAGFAPSGRVEPTWSKAASRAAGSCTVQVFVTREGTLKELKLAECPAELEDDVRAAVQASTFQARVKDGEAAAGRFRETYEVR